MNSEIPQFDRSFFASQLFWLFVTYLVFYLVLSRIVIPRIKRIREFRKHISDSLIRQTDELLEKEKEITAKYQQELQNANNQVYKLVENVRENINKTVEHSCAEFMQNLNAQTYALKKKLLQIKEEKKIACKNDIYDLSLRIFNSIIGVKLNKNIIDSNKKRL